MVSWFSSLFECLAALYFTMCLDKVLSDKIWTVDFYKRFSKVLNDIDGSISISNRVVNALKKRVKDMQDGVTNLSVVMMAVIIGLLILCGYETGLEAKGINLTHLHSAIAVTMALIGVCATVFKRFIFGSWKLSAIVLLGAVFIFGILLLLNMEGCIIEWLGNHCVIITNLALILPVIIQIIFCWAYRNLYYGFMRSKVKSLYESDAIDDKQFETEIIAIAKKVNAYMLIGSWLKHHLGVLGESDGA